MPKDKPVAAYSAADALAEASDNVEAASDNEEIEQEERQAEPESLKPAQGDEEEDAEGTPDEDSEEDKTDEASDEDSEDDDPQLDPVLAEAVKGNEKAEQRLKEQLKGVAHLKEQVKELKAEALTLKPQAEAFTAWASAFNAGPVPAGKAVEQLITSLAEHHKISPSDLLPTLLQTAKAADEELLSEEDEFGRKRPDWERRGYSSQIEARLHEELKATRREIDGLKSEQAQIAREREESRRAAEEQAHADGVAGKTIAKLQKLENGWTVTKAMVLKALREFPQLKDDPARAVKAAYPDELKAHYLKAAAPAPKERGPEVPADTRSRGAAMKNPRDFKARDAFDLVK